MQPPYSHAGFFSSLKQVEKRLESENTNKKTNSFQPPLSSSASIDTLTCPIYINHDQPTNTSSFLQDSDPPQQFLSHSIEFPPSPKDPPQSDVIKCDPTVDAVIDHIERLIGLLGLSEPRGEAYCNLKSVSCVCKGGFYEKIAGVKGPKCEKEVRRLDGWIGYFLNDGGEKREPLRLAHLLLAKAAYLDGGVRGIEFPLTIEEFLENDPPNIGQRSGVCS